MKITEIIGNRTHTYSDSGFKILQIETGIPYDDAMDIIPCPYTYEETTQKIPLEDLTSDEILEKVELAFQNGVNSINS